MNRARERANAVNASLTTASTANYQDVSFLRKQSAATTVQ